MQPTDNKPKDDRKTTPTGMLIKGDREMSIAFILPVSIFVGYGIGWFVDSRLGTKYWSLVGLLIGIVAGFVDMIRQIRAMK